MMTNRQRIINKCKDLNVKIKSLEFIRHREYCYGDSWDSSYWELDVWLSEGEIGTYDSSMGDSLNHGIELMLSELEHDINNI